MKRQLGLTLFVVATLAMAIPAQAQLLKFGLRAGVNTSSLDYEGHGDDDIFTGFYFGPMLDVNIPLVGLGADVSVLYAKRGGDDFEQTGMEIPLNAKYTLNFANIIGIFVNAGPDFFFSFSDLKDGWDKETVQVGINIGGGVKVIKHIIASVNYQIPISKAFKGSNGSGKWENTWQVGVAYVF